MLARASRTGLTALAGGTVLAVGLLACSEPTSPPVCQVPGQLGAGAFAAYDCRDQPGCLDGWRFAARSVETMIFCPADDRQVTEVVSSDPRVMVTTGLVDLAPGQVGFDLAAGDAGRATIEVRGPDLVERLDLAVEDVGDLDVVGPERVVEGGTAAITSTKRGTTGAPLFGRGGYALATPAGLSTRPATTATQDCALAQPDIVLTAGTVGSYRVTTDAPAPAWDATIEVLPAAAVTSADVTTTRIIGSATTGYSASVRVVGKDGAGHPVLGVACDWSSTTPVFIANNVCWSLVLLPSADPIDLTCSFHGRVLATAHLSNTIVL
ncbi:MAG TPA: hypothetical protein VHE35_21945 [Kofleriaceae bacterium]|nr:hypothetical protein [Kofleriaceae bacterium]